MERSGAQRRIRTTDTRIFNPLLYQLSYLGIQFEAWRLKGSWFIEEKKRAVYTSIGKKHKKCQVLKNGDPREHSCDIFLIFFALVIGGNGFFARNCVAFI
jgi:hypothetical protein